MIVRSLWSRNLGLSGREDEEGPEEAGRYEGPAMVSSFDMNEFHACLSRPPMLTCRSPPSLDSSLECLLVEFECDPRVHQSSDIVDLLLMTALQQLTVAVCVLKGNCVTHTEAHQALVNEEQTCFRHLLQLAKRNGFRPGSLNHLLDRVRSVLLLV